MSTTKAKSNAKKLRLKKERLRELSPDQLGGVNGGVDRTVTTGLNGSRYCA